MRTEAKFSAEKEEEEDHIIQNSIHLQLSENEEMKVEVE